MTYRKIRYVSLTPDRHGKLRSRFRMGRVDTYINADYGTSAWWEEYHALVKGEKRETKSPVTGGTIAALARLFYRSPDFLSLAKSTQDNYTRIIEEFCKEHGHRLVADMERKHVHTIISKKADTPNAANRLLSIIRILMRLAVTLDMRATNPTDGVRKFRVKSSGHHSWTDEEIAQFEEKHPAGSKPRLALYLMLYLAQRRSDVVKLGRQHVKGGMIRVKQQKTGADLWLPIHPTLHAELRHVSGNMTFLVTEYGRPHTANGFGNTMRKWCDEAGLPQCSSHGLRKAAATRLAEAGCSEKEIMAVTGHRTSSEIKRYTEAVNQRLMAERAAAKLSNLSTRLDKKRKKANENNG